MRRVFISCALLVLAGCAATPADLGLTGPAPPVPPRILDDSTIGYPGLPDAGGGYGPSLMPSTGGGRYYNYN
jgi:hypothetical protein